MRARRPKLLSQKVILANLSGKTFQLWKRHSIDFWGMDTKAGHASNVFWLRERLEMLQDFVAVTFSNAGGRNRNREAHAGTPWT